MGMSKLDQFENDIVKKVNFRHGTKFKLKDLMEWATTPVKAQTGEVLYEIPGYYCAFKAVEVSSSKTSEGTQDHA